MLQQSHETITAIATPIGIGGISVIRISGDKAFAIADAVFQGAKPVNECHSHTVHYGAIVDSVSRETIDTVLLSLFRNPHSYTGEDVVEISSHGGYYVAQRILTALYHLGARPAQPGEFTLRSFLNGKIDLTQAEAVADIIHSKSEKSHKSSMELLSGKLSSLIHRLREDLLNICSLLELELDFSQEGIELTDKKNVIGRLEKIELTIHQLLSSYNEGRIVREGIRVALIGKPNAGKSSLLNVLLQEERAIVSHIAGTTRDTIEESIMLEGIEFVFQDTAGLRSSTDSLEIEGIKRTSKIIEASDIILLLVDCSVNPGPEDITFIKSITEQNTGKSIIPVLNKIDLKGFDYASILLDAVRISCVSHDGIDLLKKKLISVSIPQHDSSASSITITNVRHRDALENALTSINSAKTTIINGLGGDFASVDLRGALNYLGEIIGLTTPDDILNNIFSSFCIGK